jgi:hypothetical protein
MSDQPPGEGHNSRLSKEDMARVATVHVEIIQHKAKAKSENDKANALRKELKAMGIDLQAYAAATARFKMDTDQRLAFDQSVAMVNESLGIPIQADLFGDDVDDETSADAE